MKKIVKIGLIAGAAGLVTAFIAKKINNDRMTVIDHVVKMEDGREEEVCRKESFKEAVERKVCEVLGWVAENKDKIESATTIFSVVTAGVGMITSTVNLYSSWKSKNDETQAELLYNVKEIKARLDDIGIIF